MRKYYFEISVNPKQQNVRIVTERVRDARCTRSPLFCQTNNFQEK